MCNFFSLRLRYSAARRPPGRGRRFSRWLRGLASSPRARDQVIVFLRNPHPKPKSIPIINHVFTNDRVDKLKPGTITVNPNLIYDLALSYTPHPKLIFFIDGDNSSYALTALINLFIGEDYSNSPLHIFYCVRRGDDRNLVDKQNKIVTVLQSRWGVKDATDHVMTDAAVGLDAWCNLNRSMKDTMFVLISNDLFVVELRDLVIARGRQCIATYTVLNPVLDLMKQSEAISKLLAPLSPWSSLLSRAVNAPICEYDDIILDITKYLNENTDKDGIEKTLDHINSQLRGMVTPRYNKYVAPTRFDNFDITKPAVVNALLSGFTELAYRLSIQK